ncbi:enoyl-CoA hydratase/isomerase family protein [Frankia sp. CNm7]|uniref:Enoyl-CoA hydratase/isomerase family protein n=1 Tax=Frankia nepalensis TaxID=1836974 RepID=A0A937RJT7_9ACTN|nr:enoyl-CoA hydratase-related protein [Frankia nepalensis]MBL7500498.1 enoyl-CoA hydratase/isomerase family protein [Frankia nepalensis]MBL7511223.1 enoyl-CoA hydratase/isomerase family protein [Frankia nepalensis]MBL7523367.1 enoyl-CoA hydratase/isomerase family protein [Frankia nepalensis]MBL7631477.1 enoyl-CoA hydratase/isomerase family protein [Frankia nepalensis]
MDRYGFTTIRTELDGGVLLVTLARPDRMNAINDVMHRELTALYARIAADSEVEVVVLTGEGRGFCAGGDFKQMAENNDAGYDDGFSQLFVDAVAMARNILAVRQPMIAAVNGDAIGLGATLALFCDIVYISATARIGDPHVQAGLVAADGGVVLWPMLIGANKAKEYLLTGDLLTGAEAERIGLVNHAVPAEEVLEQATATARRLAQGAALAIRFTKRLVNKDLEDRVDRIYEMALAMEAVTFRSADHLEAVKAFGERRAPVFARGLR